MARNKEKNLTQLNRLYLQKQNEGWFSISFAFVILTFLVEREKKHPKRPPLVIRLNFIIKMHLLTVNIQSTLTTANEVKRWIPNIKAEIQFCLHHLSGVRNYPDYKIKEFKERLERLQNDHKRWVRRALELNPSEKYIGVPGEPHAYVSKKRMGEINAQTTEELTNQYYHYLTGGAAHQSEQWEGWSQSQWEEHWEAQGWIVEEDEDDEKEESKRDRGVKRKADDAEKEEKGSEREEENEEEEKKRAKLATPLLDLLGERVPESEGGLEDGGDGCGVSHPKEDQPLKFAFSLPRISSTRSHGTPQLPPPTTTTASHRIKEDKEGEEEKEEEDEAVGLQLLSGYNSD